MARINYTSIVNELKGSIKGTSFQRNKSGTIAKGRSVLVFNPTANQIGAQFNFNSLSRGWQGLTLANKLLWQAYATAHTKFNYWNEEKNLSGFNWYMAINAVRTLTGQSLFDSPPVYVTPLSCPTFKLFPISLGLSFMFDSFPERDGYYLLVFATPPIRSINLQSRKHLRLIKIIEPDNVNWYDVTSDWESYFKITWPSSTTDNSYQVLMAISCVDKNTGIAGQFALDNRALDLDLDPHTFGSSLLSTGVLFGENEVGSVSYIENGIAFGVTQPNFHVIRSTDYGVNWLDQGSLAAGVNGFATVYLGNGICLAGNITNSNIWRSTDYGQTWTNLGSFTTATKIYSFVYLGGGIVVCGTQATGNILRSTDYGLTWSDLGTMYSATFIGKGCYLGNGICVFGSSPNGDVFRSTDYGATWSQINVVAGTFACYSVKYIGNGVLFAGFGNTAYIYKSTDYGATWSLVTTVAGETRIRNLTYLGFGVILGLCGATGDLLRSTDYGLTWTNLGNILSATNLNNADFSPFGGVIISEALQGAVFYEIE